MACDPTTLVAASRCLWQSMSEHQLLASIALTLCGGASVGPGTDTVVRSGHGDPDEPGGTLPIIYTNLDCDANWVWDPVAANWRELNQELATGKYACATIVELRQIGTQAACALVEAHTFGNLVAGDDQAAWYRWNPDSVKPDDSMSTLLPNDRVQADTGRWEQIVFA